MGPPKRIKRESSIDRMDDDCWRLIFKMLQQQLPLSSTCKRLRRILFNMDHMRGYGLFIQAKKELTSIKSLDDKITFLKPLASEYEQLLNEQNARRKKKLKKKKQTKFLKKHPEITIDGLDNIEYESQDLYDESTLIWYGGSASFTIKNATFSISHKYMDDYNENKFNGSVKVEEYLSSYEELQKLCEELGVTEKQLEHLFGCLGAQWTGGDGLKDYTLEELFMDSW